MGTKNVNIFSKQKRVENLNAKYAPKAQFALNKFADLSKDEFKHYYLNAKPLPKGKHNMPFVTAKPIGNVPDSWDWRTANPPVVTDVKDQGQCGSCWAFSTTGNVEGQHALKTKKLVGLSEQNLVDCDHECSIYDGQQSCDAGCEGGLMMNAFQYIFKNGGIDSEDSYAYEGEDGSCRFNKQSVAATITNWTMLSSNETEMQSWLYQNGPIAVAVSAEEWQFYIFGVFYLPCTTDLDHGVLIVGYGSETDIFGQTMPFWIIKNSWSSSWGEDGYIRLERGVNECAVGDYPCSSII